MRLYRRRLLPLWLLLILSVGPVHAQQGTQAVPAQAVPTQVVPLQLGDAVVTGFSGIRAPRSPLPAGKSAADLTVIDADGPAARIVTLSHPGAVWDGRLLAAPKPFSVAARDVGQVFGVALDDQDPPNIYLAATSQFGLAIVRRARDGSVVRLKQGGPGAGWMQGQFGLDLQGGPGAIYKIDGRTGAPALFANVTLDGVPNPGPALGSLAYDAAHRQLFVSDLYTGMIHRFDLDGRELGRFDHGVAGRQAAQLAPAPFDAANRPNIGNERFNSERPESWGYAAAARQVWGLAVHQGRLFYSVASGPQIWSVGIARDGGFADDPRLELDVPPQAGALPVSDIAFSQQGAMILAQRAPVAGAYDFAALTRPAEPRVFRVWPKRPDDPPSPGRWKPAPEEYAVGFAGDFRNTNGGVALGYGYDAGGRLAANACEFSLWTTGQSLRQREALRERLRPGGEFAVHGLAGMPSGPVRPFNEPPWTSSFIDYDDAFGDPRALGHMGGVRIYGRPCAPPAVYSGPGYPASPPFLYPPVTVVDSGCRGPDCKPGTPVDLGIEKTGGTTPVQEPYYSFTLTITNHGAPFSGGNVISVSDVLPANMAFTGISAVPAADWSCPASVPAGGTMTCNYIGSGPAGVGVIGTITINATLGGSAPYPPVTNCATVGLRPGSGFTDTDAGNDRSCVTVKKPEQLGELIVVKKVVNNGPLPLPSLTFPVAVTCGTFSHSFNLVDNVPQSVGGVPLNTDCNAMETPPSPPAGLCPPSATATWLPPSVAPSNPFQLSGITLTVTVTNTFECKPSGGDGGTLQVVKTVTNQTEADLSSVTFPATATCGGAATSLNLTTASPQTVANLAAGTVCSVAETLPPPPSTGCVTGLYPAWEPATVSPATVTIAAGGTATVTVANSLRCERGGYIAVTKNVINNTQADVSGLSFPVTMSCAGGGSPFQRNVTLTAGSTELLHNMGIGNTCTPSETLPPAPTGGCPAGQSPAWGAPVYSPATVTSVAGAGPTLTVQNTLSCAPTKSTLLPPPVKPPVTLKCPKPQVPDREGKACVCPGGQQKRGARCVTPVTCHAPARLNRAGNGCVCPEGMQLRGRSCVERPRRGPSVEDQIIRGLPGVLVPRIGGGGGGGGGRQGGGAVGGGGGGGRK